MKKNTAIITAATGKIGFAIAHELAAVGYDLILVARSSSSLEKTISEIESRHPVRVHGIVCDREQIGSHENLAMRIRLIDKEVSVFVNEKGQPVFGTNLEKMMRADSYFIKSKVVDSEN